jgi:preprotein translocase subunit SecG
MALLINILLWFYVFVALLMVLVILMQRPKSEGLGAAFGGGVTENLFGAQTTNVLTKVTTWLATLFFLLTFSLSILYAHKGNTKSDLRRELMKDLPPAAAATSPTPSPGPSSTAGASGKVISPTPSSLLAAPSVTPAELMVGTAPPKSSSVAPPASPVSSAKPASSPEPAATLSAPAKTRPK